MRGILNSYVKFSVTISVALRLGRTLDLRSFPSQSQLLLTHFTRQAADIVRRTSGIERTRILAYEYAERARDALRVLPDSDAKMALEGLTELTRSWL